MFQKEKDNSYTPSHGHEKPGLHGVPLVGDQGPKGNISQNPRVKVVSQTSERLLGVLI